MVVYRQQPEAAQEGFAKDLLPALLALPIMTQREKERVEKNLACIHKDKQEIHTSDAYLHLLLCCRLCPLS